MVTRKDLIDFCATNETCDDSLKWIRTTPGTVKQLWEKCDRPWYLRWLLLNLGLLSDVEALEFDEEGEELYGQFAKSVAALEASCRPAISDPLYKGYKAACRKYERGRVARLRVYDLKVCKMIRARRPWSLVEWPLKCAIEDLKGTNGTP